MSATFERREDALVWGREQEDALARGEVLGPAAAYRTWTVAELLRWYVELPEVKARRAASAQASRTAHLIKRLGHLRVAGVTPAHLADYKRERLVTPVLPEGHLKARLPAAQTVQLEMSLLHRAYVVATEELGWRLPNGIPKTRRLRVDNARSRRVKPDEMARLVAACASPQACIAFELAVETAMRRGEMLPGGRYTGLEMERIDWQAHSVYLDQTKTDNPRTIPLSERAEALLRQLMALRGMSQDDRGPLFSMQASSVSSALQRAAARVGSENLRFHDFRHEATSRLFEKGLSLIEVARITGHKSLSMLDRYTHLDVRHLVGRLRGTAPAGPSA